MSSTILAAESFVDLDVPVWAWIFLAATIAAMLAIDLFRHRDDHAPSPKEALTETAVWIACA